MRKPNLEIAAKIKAAVEELLKEKDSSLIGMRDVAEKCGISAANIYHYYKNKDEMLKNIGIQPKTEEMTAIKDSRKRIEMKKVTAMMNYRPEIKVVDATLRVG